jgi:hypothetical protein
MGVGHGLAGNDRKPGDYFFTGVDLPGNYGKDKA